MKKYIAQQSHGRRLPVGSELVQVSDLFALPEDEWPNVEVWLASPWSRDSRPYWMGIASLMVDHADKRASLRDAPSGMIVIARRVEVAS